MKLTPNQLRHFALDVVLTSIHRDPSVRNDPRTRPRFEAWARLAGMPLERARTITPLECKQQYDDLHRVTNRD